MSESTEKMEPTDERITITRGDLAFRVFQGTLQGVEDERRRCLEVYRECETAGCPQAFMEIYGELPILPWEEVTKRIASYAANASPRQG